MHSQRHAHSIYHTARTHTHPPVYYMHSHRLEDIHIHKHIVILSQTLSHSPEQANSPASTHAIIIPSTYPNSVLNHVTETSSSFPTACAIPESTAGGPGTASEAGEGSTGHSDRCQKVAPAAGREAACLPNHKTTGECSLVVLLLRSMR